MKKHYGFTILELVVVLGIAGVLSAVAVPSLLSMIKDNRLSTQLNGMAGLLNYARKEAVTRRATISLCASTDTVTCNSTNWEEGVIVFEGDAQTVITPPAGDVIKVREALDNNTTLRRRSNATAVPANFNSGYIRYDLSGMINPSDSSNITSCDDRGAVWGRALVINGVGQALIGTDSDLDGSVEVVVDGALQNMACP